MKTNKKIKALVEHGFKPSTLFKMNEGQIDMLYQRLGEAQTLNVIQTTMSPSEFDTAAKQGTVVGRVSKNQQGNYTVTKSPNLNAGKSEEKDKNKVISDKEMKEEMDFLKGKKKNEVKEKSVSKQQQKFMGLAYSVKKGDTPKSEVSKDVKKAAEEMSTKELKKFAETKHKGLPKKKETKENYMKMIGDTYRKNMSNAINKNINLGVDLTSAMNENIKKMVDKHITPKISKKDFVNYIKEMVEDADTKEAPSKPKTKPTTKPTTKPKPDTPYKPKPGPEKAPKAKKHETKEDTKTAPVKPTTKPTTKPGTKPRPDTPYRPKPGPEKAPKAKREIPTWLTYNEIGLNIK